MFDKNKQASPLGSEEGMKQIFSIKDCTPKEFRAQEIGGKTENTCEPKMPNPSLHSYFSNGPSSDDDDAL